MTRVKKGFTRVQVDLHQNSIAEIDRLIDAINENYINGMSFSNRSHWLRTAIKEKYDQDRKSLNRKLKEKGKLEEIIK